MSGIYSLSKEDAAVFKKTIKHLRSVEKGESGWLSPQGMPLKPTGRKYEPNSAERTFRDNYKWRQVRNQTIGSFAGVTGMWYFGAMRAGGIDHMREQIQRIGLLRHPVFWGAFMTGIAGSVVAQMIMVNTELQRAISLENSPLATEARYVLWLQKPDHEILSFPQFKQIWRRDRDSFLSKGYGSVGVLSTPQWSAHKGVDLDSLKAKQEVHSTTRSSFEEGYSVNGPGLGRNDTEIKNQFEYLSLAPVTGSNVDMDPKLVQERRERFYANRGPGAGHRDGFEKADHKFNLQTSEFDISEMFKSESSLQ